MIVLITLGVVAILVAAVIALSVRTEEDYEENQRLQRQQQRYQPNDRMGGTRVGPESGSGGGEAAEAEHNAGRGSLGEDVEDKEENGNGNTSANQ